MEALELIRTRRSVTKLVEPGPNANELQQMFEAAVLAPDHKELAPWRFLVIEGDGLRQLGDVLADALIARDPTATPGQVDKERGKPLRAPMIIAVASKRLETRLPFSELVAATCAATQNLLLAVAALGYGAIWRTGAAMSDSSVKKALGFDPDDELVGFVYLGSVGEAPAPRWPSTDGVVSRWPSHD